MKRISWVLAGLGAMMVVGCAFLQTAIPIFEDVALDAASSAAVYELGQGKITQAEYDAIEQILADAQTAIQTGNLTPAEVKATENDATDAVNSILYPATPATAKAKATAAKAIAKVKAKK